MTPLRSKIGLDVPTWLVVATLQVLVVAAAVPADADAARAGGAETLASPTASPSVCDRVQAATPSATTVFTEDAMGLTDAEAALIEAARRGDEGEAARLLAEGVRVDARDATGATALIAAAWGNHLGVACRLIGAGADVNLQDETQQSAYLIATSEGYLDVLRATLAAGADVRSLDSYRGTGLIRASERGHVEVVAELLATEIAVDHINRLGLTALLEAIMFGDGGPRHTEVVRLLIAAGADVNLADGQGVSPLAHAQQRGYAVIADLLLDAGAR